MKELHCKAFKISWMGYKVEVKIGIVGIKKGREINLHAIRIPRAFRNFGEI